jgi:hypothetical protein
MGSQMNTPIPQSLAPFLQEFDLAELKPQTAASLIIERSLVYGSRAELRWLFKEYLQAQIADWVERFAGDRLPHPHIDFWKVVLEIQE